MILSFNYYCFPCCGVTMAGKVMPGLFVKYYTLSNLSNTHTDYIPGYQCDGPFTTDMIENSEKIQIFPADGGWTDDSFAVKCKDGYDSSPPSGSLICDHNHQWINKAECLRK